MPAPKYLIAYVVTLAMFVLLDFIWLGTVATSLYQAGIGHLMAPSPNWIAAGAFYLLFPAGLVFFAIAPQSTALDGGGVALRACVLGFLAYGTYDLTNLATLRDWPVMLSGIDVIWGALVSTIATSLGWLAIRRR